MEIEFRKKKMATTMDLIRIREKLKDYVGRTLLVEGHYSSRREFNRKCMIEVISVSVFTVIMIDSGLIRSFSYNDLLDGSVRLFA